MLVIVGKSSCGKSVIEKVLETYGYENIVSYTTRPIRNGEIDGLSYHFITKNEFAKLNNDNFFAENVNNYGNFYGVAKEDCKDNSLVIVEKHGLQQLLKVEGLNITSFYLYESQLTRIKRMIRRGDKFGDIIKRSIVDNFKFLGAKKLCDYSLRANNQYVVASLIDDYYQLANSAKEGE